MVVVVGVVVVVVVIVVVVVGLVVVVVVVGAVGGPGVGRGLGTIISGMPHWLEQPLKQQIPSLGQSRSASPGDQHTELRSSGRQSSLKKTTGQAPPLEYTDPKSCLERG